MIAATPLKTDDKGKFNMYFNVNVVSFPALSMLAGSHEWRIMNARARLISSAGSDSSGVWSAACVPLGFGDKFTTAADIVAAGGMVGPLARDLRTPTMGATTLWRPATDGDARVWVHIDGPPNMTCGLLELTMHFQLRG